MRYDVIIVLYINIIIKLHYYYRFIAQFIDLGANEVAVNLVERSVQQSPRSSATLLLYSLRYEVGGSTHHSLSTGG